jgi:chemotaxis protein CheX
MPTEGCTEVDVEIKRGELAQIVISVFDSMLNLEAVESPVPWFPNPERLTAAVHLAGAWSGAVLVECDRGQACRFASRYLSIEEPGAVDDVVRDFLGELANMVGGNLKCILIPGIQLSMPSVVDGSDYSMRICKAVIRERLSFNCTEGPFWVTVLGTRP